MATEFGFSFGKMPKAGGKRLTNRTIGRYNVKTLGLKSSENKNGEREYEAGGIESCSRFGFGAREEAEIPELIERHIRQFFEIYKGETR